MRITVIAITALLLCGCKERTSESPFPVIDLVDARHETIQMSRLFSLIEYVKLETSPECLIDGKQMAIWVTEDYILTADLVSEQQSVFLFDRTTGNFIKKIGSRGRGPGEYLDVTLCSLDEETLIFYINRGFDWMGIDIETDERTYIKKPQNMERSVNGSYPYQPFNSLFPLKDGNFMTPMTNITGADSVRLAVFDRDGTILRTYPNHQTFIPESGRQSISPIGGRLYYRGDELYFYERHNDTLHVVTPAGMEPHMVFNTDGNLVPYDTSLYVPGKDYYAPSLIKETDNHVFFNYSYAHAGHGGSHTGYYDKEMNKTFVCDTPNAGGTSTVYLNDIDGLFDLTGFNINSRDEIYKRISALDVVEFMENSTQTGLVADNLRKVKEDDNPVIMIVTLKPYDR